MGSLRRHAAWLRAVLGVLLLAGFVMQSSGIALASTTGVISGTVQAGDTHQPLANVKVTAASPSGSYSATTNSRGFYSMTGVFADTYTISFQATGYQASSIPGVTVFADQVSTINYTMTKQLRQIANVVSRGGSAYQPNQTVDTVTVTAQQIQNFQGSTFNSSETNLLTSLPGATVDASGYPVIHGGREYEEGFQFEGIPYVDAYSNQFNNTLSIPTAGISLVQLTPGGGDITQGTGGGFGTFNVVSKRGQYPAYATLGGAVGAAGGFNHRLNFDWSWATSDGKFSNYLSMANSDFGPNYQTAGLPYSQVGRFYSLGLETDREVLDNFVFRFGNNKNQSLQLFMDIADHHFYENAGGLGATNQSCSTGSASTYNTLCFPNADPEFRRLWSSYLAYGALIGLPAFGSTFTRAGVSEITPLFPGQEYANQSLAQADFRAPNTYFQPNEAFKIGYTNNLDASTFLNLTAYRTNSVVTFDHAGETGSYANDYYVLQGGQTDGITLSLQKQLSDKHLLEAGVDVSHLHPVDSYRSISFSFYGSTINALGTGAYDELYLPAAFLPAGDPSCPLTTAGYQPNPVPGGPPILNPNLYPNAVCGYAYTGSGATSGLKYPMFDQVSTVNRQDYSAYISDKWQPNTRLNVQLGVRMDAATYRLPTPGIDPYTCTSLYAPTSWTPPTSNWDPTGAAHGGVPSYNCDAKATFNFPDNGVRPKVWQPRAGISYRIGNDSAVRLTYARAVQFVPIASIDYGEMDPRPYMNMPYSNLPAFDPAGIGTACGIPGFQVACRNFGQQLYWANQNMDGIAYQVARPTTSDNYQLALQHQFTGKFLNGVAINISPWYRNQHDTVANESAPITQNGVPVVVNGQVQFGPPVLTNTGKEHATGVDFNLTRTVDYGLSTQLTASYINEFSSVIPLSGSEDFYPSVVPQSVALGNEYRVGFVSPFQTTLALSYHTRSGWRITPRYYWDIGYPTGLGSLTAAYINGIPYNVPNTNAVGAGSAPGGAACFVDPMNPGSQFAPNVVGCRGNSEAPSAGGKLSAPNSFTDLTLEYAPPGSRWTVGMNVNNLFNQTLSGAAFNARLAPLATGITGPLTGYSTSSTQYPTTSGCRPIGTTCSYLSAWPLYSNQLRGNQEYVNIPNGTGRTIYFYAQVKV